MVLFVFVYFRLGVSEKYMEDSPDSFLLFPRNRTNTREVLDIVAQAMLAITSLNITDVLLYLSFC